MSNEIFRIRRLDDSAVHDIVMRAAEAARAAASADGLTGEEVKVIPEFLGISILGVLNLEKTPPKAGRYTIKTARLSLQTTIAVDRNRSNETTTIRFVLSRGAENELDQLQVSREGSSGEDRWREGRGRAAVIGAFDVLNGVIAPSDADPGSAIGQLSNFAENIDRSFRGFTQGVEGALATLAEQRAEEQRLLEAERERMRTEITEERDRIVERAEEEIEGERQRLKELEAALADREAQLDIKSHKDARRKLFAELQDGTFERGGTESRRQGVSGRICPYCSLSCSRGCRGVCRLPCLEHHDPGDAWRKCHEHPDMGGDPEAPRPDHSRFWRFRRGRSVAPPLLYP